MHSAKALTICRALEKLPSLLPAPACTSLHRACQLVCQPAGPAGPAGPASLPPNCLLTRWCKVEITEASSFELSHFQCGLAPESFKSPDKIRSAKPLSGCSKNTCLFSNLNQLPTAKKDSYFLGLPKNCFGLFCYVKALAVY